MEMWRESLEVTEEFILENIVVKAFSDNQFIGFFVLVDLGKNTWDLDAFWIVVSEIRKGYGKEMFQYVLEVLKNRKAEKLEVVSDPNANGFYEKMGGKWIRKFPSKPEGRELDVYEYNVK
jgi:GNAT superfamily N-acetyltransferase